MTTGSVLAQFTITLSQAVSEQVAVEWHTADGTALAGVDYAANKGTVIFSPSETAKTVDILVYGRAVGSEDRSFFVEMLPPVNAILGASIGECIIHVDTTGSTPVTQIIVPTGPQGPEGKSAYQTWLDLGNTGTEQDFIDSLSPSPEEIAEDVAPLIDVGDTVLTAEGTEGLSKPDETTVKAVARRVAYVGAAKIATVVLADGDNLIGQSDLTGDTVDMSSVGLYPRIMRGSIVISPQWSVEADGRLLIKGATAGDVLYVCQYDGVSTQAVLNQSKPIATASREALRRSYAELGYDLIGDFSDTGLVVDAVTDVVLWEPTGVAYAYSGILPHTIFDAESPIGNPLWVLRSDELINGTYAKDFRTIADMKAGLLAGGQLAYYGNIIGQRVEWRGYFTESDGGSNWGIVKSGAHVEDGGSIFSITPTLYVAANLKGRTLNVKKFGAKTDGSDSFTYIQAAINYAKVNKIGTLKFSSGTYIVADTPVVDFSGFGQGLNLIGDGVNETVIRQIGAGKDCLKYSATTLVEDSTIKNLTLSCSSVSGDVLNIGFGLVRCTISPRLIQENPARSVIVGNFTGGKIGVFDTVFEKAVWKLAPNSTAYGVDITCDGTIFNENKFKNLVCYNATAKQFISVKTVGAGAVWLVNNTFSDINFEVCKGGGIEYQSAKAWTFRNLSFWDAQGAYTGKLIYAKDGTSLKSVACLFENITRNGDSLAAGAYDIYIDLQNGVGNTYINCTTSSDVGPKYDLNNAPCQIIGLMYGVINGVNASVSSLDSTTTNNLFIGDNLKVYSPATAVVRTQVLKNSGTHQLSIKDNLGSEIIVATDEDGIYSYVDNKLSLGKGANRYTVVHAATGAINTSDAREKTTPKPIDASALSAWSKVEYYQFKFNDAVETKGDGARWHFGVVAQRVKEAFESEGLDAFAYGVLCYDEWPNELDEHENVVRVAGNRYGIRYDEALALEAALLRINYQRLLSRIEALESK